MRQLTALQPFGLAARLTGERSHLVELKAQPQPSPACHRQGAET
ncbi:hypothetical protein [Micrococcus terreus]|uniref:Uncharacterized protein n=1 Tax=Micrococcus terreus TaxID=574650 RepID=A0A1I7MDP2_9MICC|nr:hypothetical protein [Micrococcus terreus]SFV20053.1 hypothetical protein SAMN04487966_10167 [Micrococcus terreus]